MTTPSPSSGPVTVRLSRLPSRGMLLGLSGLQLATLGVAAVAVVIGLYTGGARGLGYAAPVWLTAIAVALVPINGQPVVAWAPIAATWAWRTATRQRSYRRRILTPETGLGLPGDAAALRAFTDSSSGAVLVHDPHEQRLVAMAEVTHRSFVLLDPEDQRRRMEGWGRVLATACRSTRLARLQVSERTLAGSGTGLSRWWHTAGNPAGEDWPAQTYATLIERAGPAAERHVTTIAIALDLHAAARPIRAAGGGLTGAATVLAQEMRSITAALTAADLAPVRWMDTAALAGLIRSAYDPQVGTRPDPPASADGQGALAAAGPMGVTEAWQHLQSDSACHAVLWVAQWPRTPVTADFLTPMLLSTGVTRTFSLIFDPIPTAQAARTLRRRKTEHIADAAQRARIGQLEDVALTAEYHDVLQQEAELTAGHGVLRYAGLLAISAPNLEALEAAVAEIEQTAIQASCDTRRLVGQQAQAFLAAAVPLCRGL